MSKEVKRRAGVEYVMRLRASWRPQFAPFEELENAFYENCVFVPMPDCCCEAVREQNHYAVKKAAQNGAAVGMVQAHLHLRVYQRGSLHLGLEERAARKVELSSAEMLVHGQLALGKLACVCGSPTIAAELILGLMVCSATLLLPSSIL